MIPRKVFIFGFSGSGKTTLATAMIPFIEKLGHSAVHLDDLTLFQTRTGKDTQEKKYRRYPGGNFGIKDFSEYDSALVEFGQQAQAELSKGKVALIEFNSTRYSVALMNFGKDFVQNDSIFIHVNTPLEDCFENNIRRSQKGVLTSNGLDKHLSWPEEEIAYHKTGDFEELILIKISDTFGIPNNRMAMFTMANRWRFPYDTFESLLDFTSDLIVRDFFGSGLNHEISSRGIEQQKDLRNINYIRQY